MIVLKIPDIEINKSDNNQTFWTIRPILRRKFKDIDLDNANIIKYKDNKFQILEFQTFDTLEEALKNKDYLKFGVGKSRGKVFRYYRQLYGKIPPSKWVLMVLQLKKIKE